MSQENVITVLCVDDNPHDRALIRHALEKEHEGFRMREAADRAAFEQALAAGGFDVVITDFNILGFEGLEVLAAVRRRWPEVPVIVVTGTGSEETAVAALKQGAQDYVIKTPKHIAQLPHAILRALEARRTKRQLYEREANLRALVENAGDGILVVDDAGIILFANPAAAEMLGAGEEELKGREFGHPVSRGQAAEIDLPRRRSGPGVAELRTAVTDWGGRSCLVVTLRDITERKRAEQEKEKLQKQLLQSQKLETVGRLAGGVAHDFNNLLTVIMACAQELHDELRDEDPLHASAAEILAAAQSAAALTRQLLAFSRKQALRPEVVDVNSAITGLARMLGRVIGEDISLEFKLAEDAENILVDPAQFEQVLMNLAVNARDAMPDGGELLIETANVDLDDDYAKAHVGVTPGRYVMLTVSDTGCGMDQQTLSQIFEPFFTTKEKGRGTGLGLATVYGIVKQSGGNIWVYSEPGQGTTFKIYLPATHEERTVVEKPVTTPARAGGEHILVVEDQDELRRLLEKMLGRLGYQVMTAPNGEQALELVKLGKWRPVLVLTDVVMPGMSGVDLVSELRQHLPQLKVVFMSGYTENGMANRRVLEPGTPFLQKPFTARDVAVLLDQLLGPARNR